MRSLLATLFGLAAVLVASSLPANAVPSSGLAETHEAAPALPIAEVGRRVSFYFSVGRPYRHRYYHSRHSYPRYGYAAPYYSYGYAPYYAAPRRYVVRRYYAPRYYYYRY